MLKIALFGLGNAAKGFLELLVHKQEEGRWPNPIVITAIATGTRGLWQGDIEPKVLLDHLRMGKPLFSLEGIEPFNDSSIQLATTADYHVLIELTPLNIHSGQPAIHHIECALSRGLGAITANKGPLAFDFHRLNQLSIKNNAPFLYETTVMDGTPIFNLVADTLPHCKVLSIEGILNSTTNFILEEMAKGHHLETILEEGRRRGFVESDPSMDIEGYDAAAKITALANVLMNANTTPNAVKRHGIAQITYGDLEVAKLTNSTIKLICKSTLNSDGTVELSVSPEHIPLGSSFASIHATSSAITIETDLMGKVTIIEEAPEIQQTAYGIYQDLLRFCKMKGKI